VAPKGSTHLRLEAIFTVSKYLTHIEIVINSIPTRFQSIRVGGGPYSSLSVLIVPQLSRQHPYLQPILAHICADVDI
jgi:hypothetical protein